jgi:predicted aspartyl protease
MESDRQSHFRSKRGSGAVCRLVVDTGASLVVLRESSIAMAGIRLQPRDYTATAVTANGKIAAPPRSAYRIGVSQFMTCRPWYA